MTSSWVGMWGWWGVVRQVFELNKSANSGEYCMSEVVNAQNHYIALLGKMQN